jgi:hypothetical protein
MLSIELKNVVDERPIVRRKRRRQARLVVTQLGWIPSRVTHVIAKFYMMVEKKGKFFK